MNRKARLYGAIEAGGTKFVCAIGDEFGELRAQTRITTREPEATLVQVGEFLQRAGAPLAAIGIASFGPVILDRASAVYGSIGKTPKPGWSGIDLATRFAREFGCPVGFDTDVNGAALAEQYWGAGRGCENLLYVTVGTGIGGGVIIGGAPVHGLAHPEIGHIYPRRHALDRAFAGVCPFHGDCLEGLASGPAIVARTGHELRELEHSHAQWELEADYLGQVCAQMVLTISPQRIILGGGVMAQERLFALVRVRMLAYLGGYIDRSEILSEVDRYLVAPGLGERAGVLGALKLALDAAPR